MPWMASGLSNNPSKQPASKTLTHHPIATAWALIATLTLSGCGSNGDPGAYTPLGGTVALYLATDNNGSGTVAGVDSTLATLEQIVNTGLDGQLALSQGMLYQSGLSSGTGKVLGFSSIATRGATVNFDSYQDAAVTVSSLVAPQGVTVGALGYEPIVADAQTASAAGPALHLLNKINGLSSGTTDPTEYLILTQAQVGAPVWATAYDVPGDRLYAARTDGVVLVYDNFYTNSLSGTVTANRTITPGTITNGVSTKISTNLHGIAYDGPNNTLYVSDIGDAANSADGALYVINNASRAQDATRSGGTPVVVPNRIITGPTTRLGNPTSLSFSNNILAVADSANNLILEFYTPSAGTTSDIAPDMAVAPSSFGVGGTVISVVFAQ